jgi:predicted Zn finger-like uncharacterized protein
MALAAVCPQCSTRFRVVADQLKLRNGWVRCGSCGFAFNAVERLSYVPDDTIVMRRSAMDELLARRSQDTATAQPPAPATAPAPADEVPKSRFPIGPDAEFEAASRAWAAPSPAPAAQAADAALPWPELKEDEPVEAAPATPAPPDSATTAQTPEAKAAAEAISALRGEQRSSEPPQDQRAADAPDAARPARGRMGRSAPPDDSDAYELHTIIDIDESREERIQNMRPADELAARFLERDAQEAARARRINRVSAFGAVIAAIALIGQLSYTFRNELAVSAPGSRPVLAAMCEVAGCNIALPAHANMLSLESLQLVQMGTSDVYQATVLVKNTSGMSLRAPHMELTLTRVNGDILARRVLAPSEWLPRQAQTEGLPARGETVAQFALQVNKASLGNGALSGFGGALFYPAP